VVSSLLFHHLVSEQKRRAFREIRRVLAADGQLHIADFGKPEGIYASVVSSVLARFDGVENTRDNFEGRLPSMLVDAGFTVLERQRFATSFGTVSLLAATRVPSTTGDES
jgi:ubiquinone/menaquinone biosynthesis C-methylase UbiE